MSEDETFRKLRKWSFENLNREFIKEATDPDIREILMNDPTGTETAKMRAGILEQAGWTQDEYTVETELRRDPVDTAIEILGDYWQIETQINGAKYHITFEKYCAKFFDTVYAEVMQRRESMEK